MSINLVFPIHPSTDISIIPLSNMAGGQDSYAFFRDSLSLHYSSGKYNICQIKNTQELDSKQADQELTIE